MTDHSGSGRVPIGLKITATMCVLKHKTSFLLLKRKRNPNKNKYTPVGGKLEPFENPMAAAIRETREESGIALGSIKYAGILTETSPTEYNWTGYIYSAEIGQIVPSKCNEGVLRWVNFEELTDLPMPKSDLFLYKYILDCKTFAFSADYDIDLSLLIMREEIENKVVYEKLKA